MLITLDEVYTVYRDNKYLQQNIPSIELSGGTINIYVSNAEEKPLKAAMIQSNADLAAGIHAVAVQCKWILFESASGSPVVKEIGLVS